MLFGIYKTYPGTVFRAAVFAVTAALSAQSADYASADPDQTAVSPVVTKPQCSYYRSKKEKIPVYLEPDSTSKVVYRLKLGEEVCYIGEQAGFAIVNWPATKSGGKGAASGSAPVPTPSAVDLPAADSDSGQVSVIAPEETASEPDPELVFVRLVDLWTPRPGRSLSTRRKGIGERLSDLYTYMRSGGVPESPIIPLGDPAGAIPSASPQSGAGAGDCGCGVEE